MKLNVFDVRIESAAECISQIATFNFINEF